MLLIAGQDFLHMRGIIRISGKVFIALGQQFALDIGSNQVIAHNSSILIGCRTEWKETASLKFRLSVREPGKSILAGQ